VRGEIADAVGQVLSKKSQDLNVLSRWFVEKSIAEMISLLHRVISRSPASGIVPLQQKIVQVALVFTSGDAKPFGNYRPISLLCPFSKICEKIHTKSSEELFRIT
jgi:hypothetical protein